MSLQPLGDRIVVRPGDAEETTVSGLVIPDTAKEKPQQGEVLAVGPGRRSEQTGELIPVDVAAGDVVLYSKYGGTEVAEKEAEEADLVVLDLKLPDGSGFDLLGRIRRIGSATAVIILSSRDVLAKIAGGKKK